MTKNMTGMKVGYPTALRRQGSNKFNRAPWLCLCDCGGRKVVDGTPLRRGKTRSCGCLYKIGGKINGAAAVRKKLPVGEANFNGICGQYKKRAGRR